MFIQVGFAWAKIVEASASEMLFLRAYLSFAETGALGKKKVRSLLRGKRMFPAGLASRLIAAARAQGFEVSATSRPLKVPLNEVYAFPGWEPRKHQRQALELLYKTPRGLIQHATGCLAGNTVIEVNRKGFSFKVPLRDLVKRLRGERIGRGGGPTGTSPCPRRFATSPTTGTCASVFSRMPTARERRSRIQ